MAPEPVELAPEPVELAPELVEGAEPVGLAPQPVEEPEPVEGPEFVDGPGLACIPEPPESRSADIFSSLERPVIAEQQHALGESYGRSVL